MTIDLSRLPTVAEASKRAPCSERAIRHMINLGQLEPVQIGAHIFLTETEPREKLGKQYHSAT